MIHLSTTSTLGALDLKFQALAQRQIPFATSLAINRIAELSLPALRSNMAVVFDRPKPFTLNSLFIKRSTKTNLTAVVFHSDKVAPYILPEITGGPRGEKRFELIIGNQVLVPTKNVRRDSYGGVSRALITKILSQAKPLAQRGQQLILSQYVIVKPGETSKLAPGLYERRDGKIVALFFFKPVATYTQRYDMQGVVDRVVANEFDRQFAAMMDYALSTARIDL